MSDLAVLILTYNEELHLARALGSVAPIAREVFVIDSGSTDRTVEIAEAAGASVLRNPFENYARQFQWGLDNAPLTAEWVMRLDADEIIEPDLAAEISEKLPKLGADIAGVNLKRKHIFLGRWIRHGGRYPLELLRIWRRDQGRIEDRWMDEHMVVCGGSTVTFEGGFADCNLKDLTFFTAKHNGYATREAIDILSQRYELGVTDGNTGIEGSRQAANKRLLKERVYNNLPFWIGPTLYFLYRYFIQLGFLDGREGLIYHLLQGFWYRFLVGAKVEEFDRALRVLSRRAERLRTLESLTGYRLSALVESAECRGRTRDQPRRTG